MDKKLLIQAVEKFLLGAAAATLLLFLSMPLVLGSLPAFVVFLVYPVIVAKRIRNEEQVLAQGLAGYRDYQQRVKYRVIPFIW